MASKQKKVKPVMRPTQHQIWTRAYKHVSRKYGASSWTDEDCCIYAYGYLDGWQAKRKVKK